MRSAASASGDYVTIVLPNCVECVEAMVACWKLGAVPQPLSPRLPDAEFEGLLELRPRALLVGRTHPGIPSLPRGFVPDQALSDDPLPEAVSPCWRSIGSGGSTGRPKLIEAGGDSRLGPALGYVVGGQEGDTVLVPVPLTHTTGFTAAAVALMMRQPPGADGPVRPARVPAADHRASPPARHDGADDDAAGAAGLPRRPVVV